MRSNGSTKLLCSNYLPRNNERRYVAGKLSDSQIWIYGDIRSGRPVEKRCLLINKFVEGVSKIAFIPATDVWVFLNNLEGSDISEWGVILPESGKEGEWFNSLYLFYKNFQVRNPRLNS